MRGGRREWWERRAGSRLTRMVEGGMRMGAQSALPLPHNHSKQVKEELTVLRSNLPALPEATFMTSLAALRPLLPLTFFVSTAEAIAKGDASALRFEMTRPWFDAVPSIVSVRAFARPENLCAWMFWLAGRWVWGDCVRLLSSKRVGDGWEREGREGEGRSARRLEEGEEEEEETNAEVSLLGGEDAVSTNTLVHERGVVLDEEPSEVRARDVAVGHFQGEGGLLRQRGKEG